MNKFEQLIEYVINDEDAKARELFHEIVVEKSRSIYEQMMEAEEDLEEAKHEEGEEDLEEAKHEELEEGEEDLEETMGGDQADDLMSDVEVEEEGLSMEADHDESDLEDRVVDLEDKLDELMAEFEALMGDEEGEEEHDDMEMDAEIDGADDMTDIEVADDELETEGMMEAVALKSAPAPTKSEEAGINKKAVVAANSGAKGAVAKPVHAGANEGGHHDSAAYRNTHKDLIGKVGNTPAQSTQKPAAATKPHLAQATGVNTKSVIQ